RTQWPSRGRYAKAGNSAIFRMTERLVRFFTSVPPGIRDQRTFTRRVYRTGEKTTQTGEGILRSSPVGGRFPVFWSSRNTMALLVFWLAATRYPPVGSMAKPRGILP